MRALPDTCSVTISQTEISKRKQGNEERDRDREGGTSITEADRKRQAGRKLAVNVQW